MHSKPALSVFEILEEGQIALLPNSDARSRRENIDTLMDPVGLRNLFITHNIGVVEYIADHVAVMKDGRIGEAGVADSVLRYPRSDYTKSLFAAVPRIVTA